MYSTSQRRFKKKILKVPYKLPMVKGYSVCAIRREHKKAYNITDLNNDIQDPRPKILSENKQVKHMMVSVTPDEFQIPEIIFGKNSLLRKYSESPLRVNNSLRILTTVDSPVAWARNFDVNKLTKDLNKLTKIQESNNFLKEHFKDTNLNAYKAHSTLKLLKKIPKASEEDKKKSKRVTSSLKLCLFKVKGSLISLKPSPYK
ncbi:hypothetical protein SteCoe_24743 [Stentor coeruleus]|uniref:Uncharacterized protein n=1 Tax=Stentor coeruleus TaxID=5963 RepID=A0A1R2BGT6_9CILI|nr:hypothetical protein SteCoe_24743 [Stentor coeruleus]